VKNAQTVQNRPNNDYDYDFASLEVAHAGNMCIYATYNYAPHIILHILLQKVRIF